jgi:hypothetical protein
MSTESTQPTVVTAKGTNGMAVAALVTGIFSIIFFWAGWLFVATAAVAIFTGVRGARAAVAGRGQRGMATAGLVLGIIAAALEFIFLVSVGTP